MEIEAILNDRPLTYISVDVTDPVPLPPSHLLYYRRVRLIPCPLDDPTNLDYADFAVSETIIGQPVDRQQKLIQQFWLRWKGEYLTSLRELHKATGHNKTVIKRGDVIIVHDDKSRLNWKFVFVMVEDLIEGSNDLGAY